VQSMPETVVWLIRHGTSTFNLEGRCQGCSDEPELTQQGREEARLSGERLGRVGIEAIISSPLRRATQSAFEILDMLRPQGGDIAFDMDARLLEIELPEWEGLPFAEIRRRFPEQFLTWRFHPHFLQMPSAFGEADFPVRSLYQRTRHVWQDLLSAYAGKSILLVTHGGTGRALITTALGLGAKNFHTLQQSNCGISRLRFSSPEDSVQLELLNDTAHLGYRLPKLKEGRTGVRLLLIPAVDASGKDLRQVSSVLGRVAVDTVFAAGVAGSAAAQLIFQGHARECTQQVSEDVLGSMVNEMLESGSDQELRHVVLAASPACLQGVLQERFGLTSSTAETLILTGPGITSVHCPGRGLPPVLQAMNIFEPKFSLMGVQS
jgi:broad specificity phosphatase PhoE